MPMDRKPFTGPTNHQSVATTTGADGKPRGKIIYRLDDEGRYESGQVFAANGALRFKRSTYMTGRAGSPRKRRSQRMIRCCTRLFTVSTEMVIRAGMRFTTAPESCSVIQLPRGRQPMSALTLTARLGNPKPDRIFAPFRMTALVAAGPRLSRT